MVRVEKEFKYMKEKSRYQLSASGSYNVGKEDHVRKEDYVGKEDHVGKEVHVGKEERLESVEASGGEVDQNLCDIECRYPEIGERYRLLQALGGDGAWRVIKARDIQSGKAVVVKIFDLSDVKDQKAFELFEREVDRLRHLDICGVPKIIDYKKERAYFYLVEDDIDAKSMQEQIEAGTEFSELQVIVILHRCLEILSQLHQKYPAMIHCDITATHILTKIRRDGSFDIWLNLSSVTAVLSKAQTREDAEAIGNAVSEPVRGIAHPSLDLYALGMTMVYVLTGKTSDEIISSDKNVQHELYLPLIKLDYLKRILKRFLESDPEKRFQTADEALESLNQECHFSNIHNMMKLKNKAALTAVYDRAKERERMIQSAKEEMKEDRKAFRISIGALMPHLIIILVLLVILIYFCVKLVMLVVKFVNILIGFLMISL